MGLEGVKGRGRIGRASEVDGGGSAETLQKLTTMRLLNKILSIVRNK